MAYTYFLLLFSQIQPQEFFSNFIQIPKGHLIVFPKIGPLFLYFIILLQTTVKDTAPGSSKFQKVLLLPFRETLKMNQLIQTSFN